MTQVAKADPYDHIMQQVSSLASQLSFGSIAGYCAGTFLRHAWKTAVFFVGAGFCLTQYLAYTGYVDVNWRKIQRDLERVVGADEIRDQHGLVYSWYTKTKDVLMFNLPSSAGFTAGLLYGARLTGLRTSAGIGTLGIGAQLIVPRVLAGTLLLPGAPVAMRWVAETAGMAPDVSEDELRRDVRTMSPEQLQQMRVKLTVRRPPHHAPGLFTNP